MRKALKIAKRYRQKHAGWWAITPEGKMTTPPAPRGPAQLINALPGIDPPSGSFYLGDGPLDVIGDAIKKIDLQYRESWDRPITPTELRAILNGQLDMIMRELENNGALDHNRWVDATVEATGITQQQVLSLPQEAQDHLAEIWMDYHLYQLSQDPNTNMESMVDHEIKTWGSFKGEAEWTVAHKLDDAARVLGQPATYMKPLEDRLMREMDDNLNRGIDPADF